METNPNTPKKAVVANVTGLKALLSFLRSLGEALPDLLSELWDRARNLGRTNYELGLSAIGRGDLVDAVFRLKMATLIDPKNHLAWYNLACCYWNLGKAPKAVEAFKKTLAIRPGYEEARFMLGMVDPSAIGRAQLPVTMPLTLIVSHFDQMAAGYDAQMSQVGYRGHTSVQMALQNLLDKTRSDYRMLELGVGTGLCGALLKAQTEFLAGVEIAREMVEIAAEKIDAAGRKIYDELHKMDLRKYLAAQQSPAFDVVFAADVMGYVGDPVPVFAGAAQALKPGGFLAFTAEIAHGGQGMQLLQGIGKFAYSPAYLRELAEKHGFDEARCEEFLIYNGYKALICVYHKR